MELLQRVDQNVIPLEQWFIPGQIIGVQDTGLGDDSLQGCRQRGLAGSAPAIDGEEPDPRSSGQQPDMTHPDT